MGEFAKSIGEKCTKPIKTEEKEIVEN